MKTSTDRILTTHVGSLPRNETVTRGVFAIDAGDQIDLAAHKQAVAEAVADVVRRQVEAGVDVVSDGEMSKISYATYIKDRITGFDGDNPRQPPRDLEEFPRLSRASRPHRRHPLVQATEVCRADHRQGHGAARGGPGHFRSPVDAASPVEGFMNAASPGVIALFQPNEHYPTHEDYLYALVEAIQPEYEGIVDASPPSPGSAPSTPTSPTPSSLPWRRGPRSHLARAVVIVECAYSPRNRGSKHTRRSVTARFAGTPRCPTGRRRSAPGFRPWVASPPPLRCRGGRRDVPR